ncbi:transcription termination factor NusA [candidate division WOR-3 bacterium]|uniref:Transcription termination/antitermination protein NusA n=1 Tax=candidate division WOR-3 bacterium TaxID=2052148 RepID=A0A9D5K7X1_UNCW3|nr:transcription termination factor NusA [candidate division WOR-3 bacterium]MBD3364008.1 transcription termination factor NusA [candidate division WOR-3 bacterium]
MESEIQRLVIQLARIRNVEVTYVYDTLEKSIISGLKRRFGREVRHEVSVDAESGDIDIAIIQTAVKNVTNISQEISLDDARKIKPDVEEGDEVKIEIPLQEVGRVAIQRTVDELSHRLREAERTKLFNEFIKKKSEIISGTIHKIEKEEILVNLGPIYGILPLRDQLKTDHHQIGAPFKFYVLRVERTPIGPRVYLSRTHPEFLKRLLAQEVPEIQQNIVEIKGVARIPGVRSKVAVTSHDEKIDPIGACVGFRKVRIHNVTKELSGEKIDVIPWNADQKVFIARAMSPARVNEVIEEEGTFTVVVPDEEFSKAIGRKGQNVWLASLLTESKLDILKDSDYRNRLFSQRMAQIMIETLDFLEEGVRKTLVESGFTTVISLFEQSSTEAAKVLGWDPARVDQLKTRIREHLEKAELEKQLFEKEKLEEMRAAAGDDEKPEETAKEAAKEVDETAEKTEESAKEADEGGEEESSEKTQKDKEETAKKTVKKPAADDTSESAEEPEKTEPSEGTEESDDSEKTNDTEPESDEENKKGGK